MAFMCGKLTTTNPEADYYRHGINNLNKSTISTNQQSQQINYLNKSTISTNQQSQQINNLNNLNNLNKQITLVALYPENLEGEVMDHRGFLRQNTQMQLAPGALPCF